MKLFLYKMFVCVNNDGNPTMSTLRYYRKDSIKEFIDGSEHPWEYWRGKHGFKCIKVTVELTTTH